LPHVARLGRRRLGALEAVRRQLQRPAEHQREREAEHDQRNDQADAPLGHAHARQHDLGGLQHGKSRRRVDHRDADHLAALEFGEQAHCAHS
jgi:hypothetical protein